MRCMISCGNIFYWVPECLATDTWVLQAYKNGRISTELLIWRNLCFIGRVTVLLYGDVCYDARIGVCALVHLV